MINVLPSIETQQQLLDKTRDEFVRAIKLIEKLDDTLYHDSSQDVGNIGVHFRHNVDFLTNFLKGLEAGEIDYAKRERDERIEQNRLYAIERIKQLIVRLGNLSPGILETMISVHSELDHNFCHLSSVSRELEFLHSHTVHHHAIIAEKLKHLGIELSANFGVAPSTLEYWAKEKNISV